MPSKKLQLLLAYADDTEPVLDGGLSPDALREVPQPDDGQTERSDRGDRSGDPNDLPLQRWGVVAPRGEAGARLLELIEPLIARRSEQQGAPARVYRVAPDLDAAGAVDWKRSVYMDESVPEAERPRYLLVLGDLDQVSAETQQVLSTDCFPGRLAFDQEEHHEAYADKLLRWERAPSDVERPRGLLYTVHDGTTSTEVGHDLLVRPGVEQLRGASSGCREVLELGDLDLPDPDDLLGPTAEGVADVLFSLSHGLAAPRRGWGSHDRQRDLQGAISLGDGEKLTARDIEDVAFLRGGIWFFMACFSGGVPANSAYHHWLSQLKERGEFSGRLGPLMGNLSSDRPFVSALPRAALANPEGPLAVIGHLDLAWTYSFLDHTDHTPRGSQLLGVLDALAKGRRSGPALSTLLGHFTEANNELATLYDREADDRALGREPRVDPAQRAHVWMKRQDLMGYLLLGDPAARLPLSGTAARPAATFAPVPPESALEPAPDDTSALPSPAAPSAPAGPGDPVRIALARRIERAAGLDIVEHFEPGADGVPRLARREIRLRDAPEGEP